jgi:hypothetical protein
MRTNVEGLGLGCGFQELVIVFANLMLRIGMYLVARRYAFREARERLLFFHHFFSGSDRRVNNSSPSWG